MVVLGLFEAVWVYQDSPWQGQLEFTQSRGFVAVTPDQLLQQHDVLAAVQALKQQVRDCPQDAKLRLFLFQLLCIVGQFESALAQLRLLQTLDPQQQPLVHSYQWLIGEEAVRVAVLSGQRLPHIVDASGLPLPWEAALAAWPQLQWLADWHAALRYQARGDWAGAQRLREQALQQVPDVKGQINGVPFSWILDSDSSLGPIIEAYINGHYAWIPLIHLRSIHLQAPTDLRDLVWYPAAFQWRSSTQAEQVGFIPCRYPDTVPWCMQQLNDPACSDPSQMGRLLLARATCWQQPLADHCSGLGQRVWMSDQDDYALMDIRQWVIESVVDNAQAIEAPAAIDTVAQSKRTQV